MNAVYFRIFSVAVFAILILVNVACSGGSRITASSDSDPSVVAVVDGEPLTLTEFERQYVKTVGSRADASDDSLAAYEDFLERWVDFRLKVRAARDAGADRDSALVAELSGYRQQFARPFLLDKSVVDPLVRQMYEKQQQMVDASHILIRVDKTASPEDTLKAFNRLSTIRDSVSAGADFGEMARRHSEDPSAANEAGGAGYEGRLGYVRGGRLVPEFEDVAFSIPIGDLSHIFRTQFGYHILVVHDRASATQDVRIAHIMVTPESEEDSTSAWDEVRAIQDSLANGVDFAELARRNSDDRSSAGNGGELGFIAIDGRLIPAIKEAAFALENIGDVSEPVVTSFGIHLLKLLERKEPASLDDAYEGIRRRVSRSGQLEKAEQEYARAILADVGYSIDTTAVRAIFGSMSGDSAAAAIATGALIETGGALPVLSIGDAEYSASELTKWAMTASIPPSESAGDYAVAIADGFAVQKAIDYKVGKLEEDNDDFRQTMTDFRDGLLLFRVMEDSVWSRATSDSTELARRYNLNPERYRHPDRTRLLGFYSRLRANADSVVTLLKDSVAVADIEAHFADTAGTLVRLDTTYVAGPTNSVFDRALSLETGEWTAPLAYNRGHIVLINDGIEPARTKTFDEARTEIVNEYQADLEKALIGELRARYGARTYPDRLTAAFAAESTEPTVEETTAVEQ
jgi:peptidyl-prolyl cis-trans isomerase SurA